MFLGMADGLRLLFEWHNIFYLLAGLPIGIIFGALPGFNPSTAMVLLLPFAYFIKPEEALIFLMSVAGAAIYGGSITAILFRTPGTVASIVTTFDGYEMTRKGRGVEALGVSVTASSFGGLLGGISLFIFAPPLAIVASQFSFPEIVLFIIWTFLIIGVLGRSLLKGIATGLLGMMLASIGADPLNGYPRMTFGIPDLFEGINFLTAIMGYFCFSEMMRLSKRDFILKEAGAFQGGHRAALKGVIFTLKNPAILLRGALIGIIIGALPAAGAAIANFVSYYFQKSISKNPEEYGSGIPEGVLAAEVANNATEGSCLIPAVTLGIPGSNIAAVLMVAMLLHGIVYGPRVFHESGGIIYALIFSIIIAQPVMFIMGLFCSKYVAMITKFPMDKVLPFLLVFILIGTFAVRNSTIDFFFMVIFGIMAYFMEDAGYPIAALVLPFILGNVLEQSFLISLKYSANNPLIFFQSTSCKIIWFLIILSVFVLYFMRRKFKKGGIES